jgi:hypothetical protein
MDEGQQREEGIVKTIPWDKDQADQLMEDIRTKRRRMAYVPVLEGPPDRTVDGWYLGMAVENSPGYHPLRPGFGPYADHAAAITHADEINTKLGYAKEQATEIVISSMRLT